MESTRASRKSFHTSCAPAWLVALASLCVLFTACTAKREVPIGDEPAHAGGLEQSSMPADAGIMRPLPDTPIRTAEFVLALNESINPLVAPVASTSAERVVFANLYETLIQLGNDGGLHPGLARKWESSDGGRHWHLHLRADARLWDGTPVTAPLVAHSWRRSADLAAAAGRPFVDTWLSALIRNLSIDDEHRMTILLAEPWPELPLLLTYPDLAVAVERPGWLWPLGSGPCRLSAENGPPMPDIVCRPNINHGRRPIWSSLTFRVLPGSDARELLEGRVDLAVFNGWRAADYFAQMNGVQTLPLPLNRLYLLLIPPESTLDRSSLAGVDHAPATMAESIPWTSLFLQKCPEGTCLSLPDASAAYLPAPSIPELIQAAGSVDEIQFLDTDRDARALASRIAAFLAPGFHSAATAPSRLKVSLRQGQAAGYVIGLEALLPGPCLALSSLLTRAPWLDTSIDPGADPCLIAEKLMDDGLARPLAATRPHLAWRGPIAGLRLAHDGTPLVAGLGLTTASRELP
jgi:hypothetical protein